MITENLPLHKIGLVLEGGGMRGLYTAGALDFLMEQNLFFPYIVGVSAGACHACSYVSRQKGRSLRAVLDFIGDPRYFGITSLLSIGEIMDMDFLFWEIPVFLLPMDYDTFYEGSMQLVMGITNCITGKSEYYDVTKIKDKRYLYAICRASSSLPFLTKKVGIGATPYLDGSIADSIPLRHSIADGHPYNIVICTRERGYKKAPASKALLKAGEIRYKNYPGLQKALKDRSKMYNKELDFMYKQQKSGKAFVLQPENPVAVHFLEKDPARLRATYDQGYSEMHAAWPQLKAWLERSFYS